MSQAEAENAKRQAQESKREREAQQRAQQENLSSTDRKSVVNQCADFARVSAKNPDSVKFDFPLELTPAAITDDNKLVVLLDFHGTNSFNAVVPSKYACTFKNDRGKWVIENFGGAR
jgi:sRNA-binding protein